MTYGVIRTYSRTALAESVVLNFVNVFTYSSVLLYTLQDCEFLSMLHYMRDTIAYAVSGASLSLFSSRYLTSEINKQPALLNSITPSGSDDTIQMTLISPTCAKFQRRRIFFLGLRSVPQPGGHWVTGLCFATPVQNTQGQIQ